MTPRFRYRSRRTPPRKVPEYPSARVVPTSGPQPPQPHLDPTSWGRLIDSLDAATIFVVLSSWIGPQFRREISPEDIWQETLLLGWRDRQQHVWRNLAAYRAWLLGIARHRIDDACRRAGRQKRGGGSAAATFTDLAGQDSVSGYLPPRSTTPSRVAGHRERATLMEGALQSLEEPLQDLVRLRLFEELPVREIAEQLAIPLSTAKERLVRGVQRYRERLARMLRGDSIAGGEPS